LVGRMSGDEFYIILPGFKSVSGQTEKEIVDHTTERIYQIVIEQIQKAGIPAKLEAGVSFGLVVLGKNDDAKSLFSRADALCLQNKRQKYSSLKKSGKDFRDDRLLN